MHENEKWQWSHSVVSDSSWPHGLQPTRLLCPCDCPGKSTGVGCHCLLQYVLNSCLLLHRIKTTFHTGKFGASLMAQTVKHLPAMWETQVWSLGQEDSMEKEMARVTKESDTTERLHFLSPACLRNPFYREHFFLNFDNVPSFLRPEEIVVKQVRIS